jgi:hypothetical protein
MARTKQRGRRAKQKKTEELLMTAAGVTKPTTVTVSVSGSSGLGSRKINKKINVCPFSRPV